MKAFRYIFVCLGALLLGAACSDKELGQNDNSDTTGVIEIQGIAPSLGSKASEPRKYAIGDYSVNTELDPTATLDGRTDWDLTITVYKNGVPYSEGTSAFTWDGVEYWTPDDNIYFPNYREQELSALMTPPGWAANGNTIAQTQNTDALLFGQDVLIQNSETDDGHLFIDPAHIPTIEMRHAHSMLDFILYEVEESQIADVKVYIGNDEYLPYRVATDTVEYLLIVPVGTANPVVHITTVEGARYQQEIPIDPTRVNHCYCITLSGLELLLSTVTVSNWIIGEAVAAEYSTVTSYPTFRGPAGTYVILHYDNGLSQRLTFNTQGESTTRAVGRTVVALEPQGGTLTELDEPYILRGMIIDLNGIINSVLGN